MKEVAISFRLNAAIEVKREGNKNSDIIRKLLIEIKITSCSIKQVMTSYTLENEKKQNPGQKNQIDLKPGRYQPRNIPDRAGFEFQSGQQGAIFHAMTEASDMQFYQSQRSIRVAYTYTPRTQKEDCEFEASLDYTVRHSRIYSKTLSETQQTTTF